MNVVIVGGGFGGLKTALLLDKVDGIKVTLISDKDHFVYYPSLYGVATGGAMRQSFVPIKTILRGTQIKFVQDRITGYDPHRRIVSGKKDYSYELVVFALGVVTSFYNIKGLSEYSFGIKSHEEVSKFRNHLHDELVRTKHLDKQYVIVGAGPTGVELAASLAYYIDHIARAHSIKHSRIRIKLIEAAPRVLPRMSPAASAKVARRLRDIGVNLQTGEKVEWQDDDEVYVSGKSLPTRTVVWTSGVANHPFFKNHTHHFKLAANGRVIVDEHMMSGPHSYVIGDNADTKYSGLAQTALHDAIYVSRDITRQRKNYPRPAYKQSYPPIVVPVGKHWAIFEWHGLRLTGWIGYLLRRSADFIGYSDVLPVGLAFGSWRSEASKEDSCEVCKNTP